MNEVLEHRGKLGITKMRESKKVNLGHTGPSIHEIWKSQHVFAFCIMIFSQISSFPLKNTPIK